MPFVNIRPIPWYLLAASSFFAWTAILSAALPWFYKVILLSMVLGLFVVNMRVQQKPRCLLNETVLLPSSYRGRYLIFLNWREQARHGFCSRTASMILCCWHYDRDTWRQWQVFLRQPKS